MPDREHGYNLAFVPPARRATVQRRINILDDHLRLQTPTVEDADRAAELLGMTRHSFYRLLRAWRKDKDPASIGLPGRSKQRGRRVHPGDDFVVEILGTLPTGRPIERDVAAIMGAAQRRGVEIRSHSSLFAMVRELRGPKGAIGLFIDHVVIRVAVYGPEGPTMPLASVLGDGATGEVHAITLSNEIPNAGCVSRVLARAHASGVLQSGTDGERTILELETEFSTDWTPLIGALSDHGVDRRGEDRNLPHGGRLGYGITFPRLLGIPAMPRLVARATGRRRPGLKGHLDEVLTLELAQSFIDERVAAASSGRQIVLGDDVEGLLVALRDLDRP